jgi:hypothetical protein
MYHLKKTIYLFFSLLVMLASALQPFSSSGTINSSSTISSGGTISYQTIPNSNGIIYLIYNGLLSDGNGNPNSVAQRIVAAHDTYGRPEWVELRNYGYIDSPNSVIDFFHAHGIKVAVEIATDFGNRDLNTIMHSMSGMPTTWGGSIDWVMSIGSHLDMVRFDECDPWLPDYYQVLCDYVHGLGKLVGLNAGTSQNLAGFAAMADWIGTEFDWYYFIQNNPGLIAQYPQKFWGCSNDWGYANGNPVALPPTSASGDRPAYSPPLSEARALWETRYAWQHGAYWFDCRPGEGYELPSWWEDYLSQLP